MLTLRIYSRIGDDHLGRPCWTLHKSVEHQDIGSAARSRWFSGYFGLTSDLREAAYGRTPARYTFELIDIDGFPMDLVPLHMAVVEHRKSLPPMPLWLSAGRKRRYGRMFRGPRTTGELRAICAADADRDELEEVGVQRHRLKVRARRGNVPTRWDDIYIGFQRSWKAHRLTRYR